MMSNLRCSPSISPVRHGRAPQKSITQSKHTVSAPKMTHLCLMDSYEVTSQLLHRLRHARQRRSAVCASPQSIKSSAQLGSAKECRGHIHSVFPYVHAGRPSSAQVVVPRACCFEELTAAQAASVEERMTLNRALLAGL